MNMDTWIAVGGVVVGLVLAIPLHIAANRVDTYLDKHKLIKSRRSKEQALAEYKRIEAFRNGTKDRYPYYIFLSAGAMIFAIGSATCLILTALKYVDFMDLPNPLLILAFLFGVLSVLFLAVIAG